MDQACLLCDDGSHRTENCIFPVGVERCKKCQHCVLGNSPHSCNNKISNGYRPAVLAGIPMNRFKFRWADYWQQNGATAYYYDQRGKSFKELFPDQAQLCPSTSGMFVVSKTNVHMVLHYNALKPVRFSFFIATLKNMVPIISMRVAVTDHGLVCIPFKLDFNFHAGKYSLDQRYSRNNVLILGFKPHSAMFKLQIKIGGSGHKTATWQNNEWTVDDELKPENILRYPNLRQAVNGICFNCDNRGANSHSTEVFMFPNYTAHCYNCLVVSFDGSLHQRPCMPINTISPIIKNIMSRTALTLYQISYKKDEANVFFFDGNTFSEISAKTTLIAPSANSLISASFNDTTNEQVISLKQSTFNRCGILIAILDKSRIWRLRMNVVVTAKHSVKIFKLTRTLVLIDGQPQIPNELKKSTIAMLGILCTDDTTYIKFRVFANKSGQFATTKFGGFEAFVGLDVSTENIRVEIDNALEGTKQLYFNRGLQDIEKSTRSSGATFKAQCAGAVA